jgi:hypothetical protein
MFNSILKNKTKIISTLSSVFQNDLLLSSEEWCDLEHWTCLLNAFKICGDELSSQVEPTINLVIGHLAELKEKIDSFQLFDENQAARLKVGVTLSISSTFFYLLFLSFSGMFAVEI